MSLTWQDPESRQKPKPEISLPLFEQAHARKADPVHSHEAAKSVVNLGRTKDRILQILRNVGPMTDEQLVAYFDRHVDFPVSPSGIRTRRSWLEDHGFVVQCGISKTKAGRACTIWRLA